MKKHSAIFDDQRLWKLAYSFNVSYNLTLTRPIGLPGTFLYKNNVNKGWLVWINIDFFSSISFVRISYKTIWLKKWSWCKNPLKIESWKGLNWYLSKDVHQKSEGGQWGPIKKKLDSFPMETSKNHLIRNFLRNGRLRVKTF